MIDLFEILHKIPTLSEGVKVGSKELSTVLSRSDDYRVGIEYEFDINRDHENLKVDLEKIGLWDTIEDIVPEHNKMSEVITKRLTLSQGINHIKTMFDYLSKIESRDTVPVYAGLHISISSPKLVLNDFNMLKFILILNAPHISKFFQERTHVKDIHAALVKALREFDSENYIAGSGEWINSIEDYIQEYFSEDILHNKYLTVNFKDFFKSDGRIELRFFGGGNYHQRFDEIKHHLLRAIYIMEIGYGELYQKEYYKELYDTYKLSILDQSKRKKLSLTDAYKKQDAIALVDALASYKGDISQTMRDKFERIILKDTVAVEQYLENLNEGERFREYEKMLVSYGNARGLVKYLTRVVKRRVRGDNIERTVVLMSDKVWLRLYIAEFDVVPDDEFLDLIIERNDSDVIVDIYEYVLEDLPSYQFPDKFLKESFEVLMAEWIARMNSDELSIVLTQMSKLYYTDFMDDNYNTINKIISTLVNRPGKFWYIRAREIVEYLHNTHDLNVDKISENSRAKIIQSSPLFFLVISNPTDMDYSTLTQTLIEKMDDEVMVYDALGLTLTRLLLKLPEQYKRSFEKHTGTNLDLLDI